MGTQIIKQTDSTFALFSSITGNIVLADATAEEVIDFFVQEKIDDTRRSISRVVNYVADDDAGHIYLDHAITWKEAQEKDREHGGSYSRGELTRENGPYIVVDNYDENSLNASLSRLSIASRAALLNGLKAIQEHNVREFLLREVRTELDHNYGSAPGPIGVVFDTRQVNGAHFLSPVGSVLFDDGTVLHHAFENVAATLEMFYGCVPAWFTVALDLATGTFDDDARPHSVELVRERLGRIGCVLPTQPNTGTVPDSATTDGIPYDASVRSSYLKLKALPENKVLYLARSHGRRLKERGDTIYWQVADENTDPTWVTNMAAWIALENGWIDGPEHDHLVRRSITQ